MPITLKSTGGGSITLDAPSTGTDYKLTTPALGGTVAVQSGALTAGSIPFANTAGHLIQNNSNLFWDNTNGYLGIGIAAPSYKFHVYQATSADVGMSIQNGTANYASYLSLLGSNVTGTAYNNISCGDGTTTHWQIGGFGTAYSLAFRTNGANERMRIDSSGNVGIGTTPGTRLAVSGGISTDADCRYNIYSFDTTAFAAGVGGGIIFGGNYSASAAAGWAGIKGIKENGNSGDYAGALGFMVRQNGGSNTERIRIGSDGTFYNGSPGNFTNTSGSGRWATYRFELSAPNTTAATDMMYFRNTNGIVGAVGTNGSSTYYNTSSDYRLKENVAPMIGALNKVLQLKPVTFTWKSEGTPGQGFIAHELQEIIPDAVTGHKDAVDEEGNPHYQGVDASFLVATLTAAIQELSTKLDEANARISQLENK